MRFSASFLYFLIGLLRVRGIYASLLMDDEAADPEDKDLSKAILEMLHINKLSAPQQAKPHPYMKHVYRSLNTQARDLSGADGTLVQSFRSIEGKDSKYGTPGWIWFNMSQLSPFMRFAELVLLRKTLHHKPLSVTVTVHSLSPERENLSVSGPLAEHLLSLHRLPPSGYDVFDVTAAITPPSRHSDILGFQLRFEDESGSLVLHEALTQSLYCLNGSSLSQPLLVVYRTKSAEPPQRASGASSPHRHRQSCRTSAEHEGQRIHLRTGRHAAACRLYERHVNLQTSKLSQWILQPSSFNISICRGICLKETSASSVTLQRKHQRESDSFQRSHCTPQGLSSLIVMYSSDTMNIIIKELKDVRAERCVCLPAAH